MKITQNLFSSMQYLFRISVGAGIIMSCLLLLPGCDNSSDDNTDDLSTNTVVTGGTFSTPQQVTINGFTGNAMEPCISRDGSYLFFNTDESTGNKDIYYASAEDDTTFNLKSALDDVNSTQVDGTPAIDAENNFYYISTAGYNNIDHFDSIYTGTFNGEAGTVTNIAEISGLADNTAYHVNFDVDISPDGSTLYYVDGEYDETWKPVKADIAIALKERDSFAKAADSETILKEINTDNLEYAPCISINGCELFFTRYDETGFGIYRAVRTDTTESFGKPEKIDAISGDAEGPTLSPDGRSLYYHVYKEGKYLIYRVSR